MQPTFNDEETGITLAQNALDGARDFLRLKSSSVTASASASGDQYFALRFQLENLEDMLRVITDAKFARSLSDTTQSVVDNGNLELLRFIISTAIEMIVVPPSRIGVGMAKGAGGGGRKGKGKMKANAGKQQKKAEPSNTPVAPSNSPKNGINRPRKKQTGPRNEPYPPRNASTSSPFHDLSTFTFPTPNNSPKNDRTFGRGKEATNTLLDDAIEEESEDPSENPRTSSSVSIPFSMPGVAAMDSPMKQDLDTSTSTQSQIQSWRSEVRDTSNDWDETWTWKRSEKSAGKRRAVSPKWEMEINSTINACPSRVNSPVPSRVLTPERPLSVQSKHISEIADPGTPLSEVGSLQDVNDDPFPDSGGDMVCGYFEAPYDYLEDNEQSETPDYPSEDDHAEMPDYPSEEDHEQLEIPDYHEEDYARSEIPDYPEEDYEQSEVPDYIEEDYARSEVPDYHSEHDHVGRMTPDDIVEYASSNQIGHLPESGTTGEIGYERQSIFSYEGLIHEENVPSDVEQQSIASERVERFEEYVQSDDEGHSDISVEPDVYEETALSANESEEDLGSEFDEGPQVPYEEYYEEYQSEGVGALSVTSEVGVDVYDEERSLSNSEQLLDFAREGVEDFAYSEHNVYQRVNEPVTTKALPPLPETSLLEPDKVFITRTIPALAHGPGESSRMSKRNMTERIAVPANWDCIVCRDRFHPSIRHLTAPCGHHYCEMCTRNLVQNYNNSETLHPLRCCKHHMLDTAEVVSLLPTDMIVQYNSKHKEYSTPIEERLYCPGKTCGNFIPKPPNTVLWTKNSIPIRAVPRKDLRCLNCSSWVCVSCKEISHPGSPCEDKQERQTRLLAELAKEKGWQTCSNCKVIVEKIEGCLHMTCRCGHEFCYRCGAKYTGPGMCGH